jgi:hypothetical protein
VAAPDFVPAGFFELIALVCQIALPIVVKGLLEELERNPQEKVIKQGLFFSLAIFGCKSVWSSGSPLLSGLTRTFRFICQRIRQP